MKLIADKITREELREMAKHMEEEEFLLKQGSKQVDVWGINIYPNLAGDEVERFRVGSSRGLG